MKSIDLTGEIPSHDQMRLSEISKYIYKSRKMMVLTGAGISCNAGIPDFRSSDGLYNMVKSKFPLLVVKGQDLFDISIFRDERTLSMFCTFMESLYLSSCEATPTETHKFIKNLKEKKKLLRCYTQNIDGLEEKMGLKLGVDLNEFGGKSFNKQWQSLDVVQLHGSLNHLSCTQCFRSFSWNGDYRHQLSQGINPECENCQLKYQERLYLGKRLTGNCGILRPNIVLYGEHHPQAEVLAKGINKDSNLKPDMLVIMGTSLRVDGVKKLVKNLAISVHNKGGKVIFVNKTPVSQAAWTNVIDYEVLCDCDKFIDLLKLEVPDLFLTQEQLDSKRLNQKIFTPPTTPEGKLKHELDQRIPSSNTEPATKVKQEHQSEVFVKQEDIESSQPAVEPAVDPASKVSMMKQEPSGQKRPGSPGKTNKKRIRL